MQTEEKSVEPHDVLNVFSAIVKDNRQAMAEFNQAMQRREELSIRIGRRTTQILRYGVIGMLLINGILFFWCNHYRDIFMICRIISRPLALTSPKWNAVLNWLTSKWVS
jgi:hypothetical protein